MNKNLSYEPEELIFRPLEVEVKDGGFEDASRRFKTLVQKDGILNDFRQRQEFEKPSEKRRRKEREAAERNFIERRREEQMLSGEWDKIQKRKEEKKKQKSAQYEERRKIQENQ